MTARTQGFSIVEALVATLLVGVASTLLASALTVRTAARRHGARDAIAARALGDLLTTLGARACTASDTASDSSVRTAAGVARVRWHARRSGAGWAYAESVFVGPAVVAAAGTVPCT